MPCRRALAVPIPGDWAKTVRTAARERERTGRRHVRGSDRKVPDDTVGWASVASAEGIAFDRLNVYPEESMDADFPIAGATLVALQAFPASAQVVDFVDHYDVGKSRRPGRRVDRAGCKGGTDAGWSPPSRGRAELLQANGRGFIPGHDGAVFRKRGPARPQRHPGPGPDRQGLDPKHRPHRGSGRGCKVQVVDRASVNVNPPPGLSSQEAGTVRGQGQPLVLDGHPRYAVRWTGGRDEGQAARERMDRGIL